MKVDKFKRQATLRVSTGGRLDVNFFLSYSTDEHLGRELIESLQKIMKRVEGQLNKWRGSCMRQG